ncbi:MAG TPA: ABC transporter permease [Kiritimatiellia bacterium]|nr:ABC transporter permease [Kiritimatiellia bacterium]
MLRIPREARLAARAIGAHKLRSLLTMSGMVFGVGSVIAMLAVGEGASREAVEEIKRLGSNNIFIRSIKPSTEQDGRAVSRLSIYGLLYEDEERIRQGIPHIRRVVPVRAVRRSARLGERSAEIRMVATTPEWFALVPREVLAGRVLNARDSATGAPVCVLTESGARRLLATEHAVGERIRIGAHVFEVVGIIAPPRLSSSATVSEDEVDAYVPIEVARRLLGEIERRFVAGSFTMEQVELHELLVEVTDSRHVEPVAEAIEAMLRHFHRMPDYQVKVPLALLREAEKTKKRFNIVLGSIAGISLLVGGIGIMNIMLASVTERTREIGIRRALGARRRHIIRQFLIETVVLSVTGGLIGMGLGLALPKIITSVSGMPTVVPLYGIVLSFGISVLTGIVFGLYPALRAARLDPIEALRHE